MLFLANRQLDVQKIEGIKQIASLKQQIGDLQTRLDELQHAHQATLNELTRRSGEYDSLSNAYSQMLSEKKDLQQQLEQTMNSYKNMNLQVQDQITESNKEKCEMKMELDKLRKTYNELLAELQNTKTKHELEIEHLRQQLKDNQQQSNEGVFSLHLCVAFPVVFFSDITSSFRSPTTAKEIERTAVSQRKYFKDNRAN
jgi:chromosome segregation ATPase